MIIMSRIGKIPVTIPEGVEAKLDADVLSAKGVKGELKLTIPKQIALEIQDGIITVTTKRKTKFAKSLHGTYRALIANIMTGVSEGWSKSLELVGTGYRASVAGDVLTLIIGFSHPVEIKAPEGISFSVEKSTVTITGINKELVGKISAEIRAVRPPEPYKGKGIKYVDEVIRRKPGKAAKAQSA
jgi:large subunit ribosomal protein L6